MGFVETKRKGYEAYYFELEDSMITIEKYSKVLRLIHTLYCRGDIKIFVYNREGNFIEDLSSKVM